MKKFLPVAFVLVFLSACGGKKSGESDTPAADLSENPDYKKGLALVSKPGNLCLTCHKIDEKITGPAYRDVANKYENTEANVKMLAEKIMKGGTGVWGDIIMPPNTTVTQEEAEAIVKYILLLKK